MLRNSIKIDVDANWHRSRGHCRWLYAGEKAPQYDLYDKRYHSRLEQSNGRAEKECVAEDLRHSHSRGNGSVKEYCDTDDPRIVEDVQQDFEIRARTITAADELIYKRDHEYIQEGLWGRGLGSLICP